MKKRYCLDANIFIEPWNKFYSIKFTKNYWEILDNLAKKGLIFSPVEVKKEIEKIDDDLLKWIKDKCFFKEQNESTQKELRKIMEKYPKLVDATKGRSIADPWVIAHAKSETAVVVTLEQKASKTDRIKIPDVCEKEKIECIDIYDLIGRLKIKFKAMIEKGI